MVSDPPTNKHTNPQTGAITICCTAASAECNDTTSKVKGQLAGAGAYCGGLPHSLFRDLMLLVHGVREPGYLAHSGSCHRLPRTAKYICSPLWKPHARMVGCRKRQLNQGSYSPKHIVRTMEQRSYGLRPRYDTTYSQNVSQTVIVS